MAMLGSRWIRAAAAAAALATATFSPASFAQEEQPESEAVNPAWQAALAAMVRGPDTVQLKDQAQLALPAGYGFVPPKEGAAVMDQMGNQTDERFLGLIFPESDDANWFVTVDYEPSGYIKDDDAKDWNADELLQSLKDGTEAGNEHRREIGVTEIEVTRWVERPAYDASTHRLVWSAEARDKSGQDADPVVNYNTYVLGRHGYVSLNLITSSSTVEADKPAAHELLAAVNFNDGKRYADFDSSTDQVATYGLAALVGGLAAKKLGLLAAAGVFIAKFAKLIIVGVAAAGAGVVKFLKGRGSSNA
ncbi:MAG: DUF2167 domain-containing protein [Gammaproteobacteria bacterium]|nr:DUF2167 domain-containing protein [Gammaproteobacteria bacterium]